jgi:hypothetical protein
LEVKMNTPKFIVVHCSDSEWGTQREIDSWHKARGWAGCGYQFIIINGQLTTKFLLPSLNGSIEVGRPCDEEGAHCIGYNARSIGICGIAKDKWTDSQIVSLTKLIQVLCRKFSIPVENVLGHCETESGKKEGKTCPNMDMVNIREMVKEGL